MATDKQGTTTDTETPQPNDKPPVTNVKKNTTSRTRDKKEPVAEKGNTFISRRVWPD